MKTAAGFCAGVLVLGLCLQSAAAETNGPAAPAPAFTESQILESWGWMITRDKNIAGIEVSPAELADFLRGFSANLAGRPAPQDLKKIYWDIAPLARARREKFMRARERKNEAAAKLFFNRLKQDTNYLELPGNVGCEILNPGRGDFPRPQQTVNVHYTGRLLDGTEFIQMGPLDMILVTNHGICRGWVDAVQKIKPGGALKLYVPPPLSQADADQFGVPPGSALVFDIELLGIKDTAPQDLADVLTPMPPPPPPPPPAGYSAAQIIETWGWITASETHAARFGLSPAGIEALKEGLTAGIQGRPAPYDLDTITPLVEQFVNEHLDQAREAFKQKQLADLQALFARLKQDTNVVELPDGLRYEILRPGHGPYPRPDQTVKVNYTGRLLNGRVFDSTALGPLDIDLDKVIPGWTEGVQKINAGGKIKLYIPPALGYGDAATSGIPPDSTLIFEIELLEIKDAAPATH